MPNCFFFSLQRLQVLAQNILECKNRSTWRYRAKGANRTFEQMLFLRVGTFHNPFTSLRRKRSAINMGKLSIADRRLLAVHVQYGKKKFAWLVRQGFTKHQIARWKNVPFTAPDARQTVRAPSENAVQVDRFLHSKMFCAKTYSLCGLRKKFGINSSPESKMRAMCFGPVSFD